MALKDVYIALNKLHSKMDKINSGDDPYYQFRYLWSKNGDNCQYLAQFAKQMPLDQIPELEQLVKAYNEYVNLGTSSSN
jgi:hypothetical protein